MPAAFGVALIAMLIAVAGLFLPLRVSRPPTPPGAPRLSIAVLPFRDLSDDRCCAYLADAVSDDLTTDLSHIPGSVVIARESSDMYRNKSLPTAQIGHALNVRYLLEGSLRAVEGQFSINAQLIEAATGAHLWAERFTVPRAHLGEAQDDIVHRLASALGVTLTDIEGTAAARERGGKSDALDLFLQARSILDHSDTLIAMTEAQHLLEQAVAKQPDFADALAELAWLLPRKASIVDPDADADIAEARRVVADALRVAPNAPLALAARGALLTYEDKCDEARASYDAALAVDPDNTAARIGSTVCLTKLGEFAAVVKNVQQLLRSDPENPNNKVRYYQLGFAEIMLDQPQAALDSLTKSLAGDAEPVPGAEEGGRLEWSHLMRIAAMAMSGDDTGARAAYERFNRVWPYRSVWRLGAKFTRHQVALPAFKKVADAIAAAGMPRAFDETIDLGVAPTTQLRNHPLYAPTPVSIPSAGTITTRDLRARIAGGAAIRVVNMGVQAVRLPGTSACDFDPQTPADLAACVAMLRAGSGPVVVMGANPMDWQGYDGALALANSGVTGVLWFRGGAEAWALAGGPYQDGRLQ